MQLLEFFVFAIWMRFTALSTLLHGTTPMGDELGWRDYLISTGPVHTAWVLVWSVLQAMVPLPLLSVVLGTAIVIGSGALLYYGARKLQTRWMLKKGVER